MFVSDVTTLRTGPTILSMPEEFARLRSLTVDIQELINQKYFSLPETSTHLTKQLDSISRHNIPVILNPRPAYHTSADTIRLSKQRRYQNLRANIPAISLGLLLTTSLASGALLTPSNSPHKFGGSNTVQTAMADSDNTENYPLSDKSAQDILNNQKNWWLKNINQNKASNGLNSGLNADEVWDLSVDNQYISPTKLSSGSGENVLYDYMPAIGTKAQSAIWLEDAKFISILTQLNPGNKLVITGQDNEGFKKRWTYIYTGNNVYDLKNYGFFSDQNVSSLVLLSSKNNNFIEANFFRLVLVDNIN